MITQPRARTARFIACPCGECESMSPDEQRHHSQTFRFLKALNNGEAIYECPHCKTHTESHIESYIE